MAEEKPVQYDLKIDLDNLEKNAIDQVEMVGRASRAIARLKKVHAESVNALELMEALLKRSIRRDPSKFGVPDGKLTEGSITEAMTVHPDYQEASKAVIDAKYNLDLMEGIKNGLEHRKRMIETEVELWLHSYFARPNIQAGSLPSAGNVREAVQTANKRTIRAKTKPLRLP